MPSSANLLRILLIEDNHDLAEVIRTYLETYGFRVLVASSKRDMTLALGRAKIDLVLLDLSLGADDGLDLLRTLRQDSDLPIIIITGQRSSDADRVIGLELGADDYMVKPLSMRELLARIRVILRRRSDPTGQQQASSRAIFRFGGWLLDTRKRALFDPSEATVRLSKSEYNLLFAFLNAPLRPLSREYLLQAVRLDQEVYDRTIDIQILRLRRKLEADPRQPQIIKTERGLGYIFTLAVQRE
jgi:two-component system, OmpR family, response regulator